MHDLKELECINCVSKYNPDTLWNTCPGCGMPLLVRYNLETLRVHMEKEQLITQERKFW